MDPLKPEDEEANKINRTTISSSGAITEEKISLSKLKTDAMDLSDNNSLLLTREAAVRITERAITAALATTWTSLIKETSKQAAMHKESQPEPSNLSSVDTIKPEKPSDPKSMPSKQQSQSPTVKKSPSQTQKQAAPSARSSRTVTSTAAEKRNKNSPSPVKASSGLLPPVSTLHSGSSHRVNPLPSGSPPPKNIPSPDSSPPVILTTPHSSSPPTIKKPAQNSSLSSKTKTNPQSPKRTFNNPKKDKDPKPKLDK